MANNLSQLDANQALRSVYDINKNCLRVCVVDGSGGGGPPFEVIIDHTTDSIRLGDGTNLITATVVPGKVALDVNVVNEIDIRDLDVSRDSVKIGDGTDLLEINTDGSINTNVVPPNTNIANPVHKYGEITAIASSTETTVVSHTTPVGKTSFLQRVTASGSNIAEYKIKVNGVVIQKGRTDHRSGLNIKFQFDGTYNNGQTLLIGDIVTVTVIHYRPFVGDFNAVIQTIEMS